MRGLFGERKEWRGERDKGIRQGVEGVFLGLLDSAYGLVLAFGY